MNIKQGAGNTEGDLYQLWLGVLKIKDWILAGISLDVREKFWLEQEIGSSNAGIFDDIQVFENNEYQFYQVKHTINIKGDLIIINDLTNAESKIFIPKIYDSYVKIKALIKDSPYKLIIFSNKSAGNILRNIIKSNGQFINSIKYISPRAKPENKEIRNKLLNLCGCSESEFVDMLNHLYFDLRNNDLDGVSSKIKQDLDDSKLVDHIFGLVRKSHKEKFKVSYEMIEYYLKNKKSYYKGFNVIMEKIIPPNLLLIRENIEILGKIELRQEDIEELLWEIRKESYNIIYIDQSINKEILSVVNELVDFYYSFMKGKNEKIQSPIYSGLYLLTLKQETSKCVNKIFIEYFSVVYENNEINKDLVNILDNFNFFGNRTDEIIKAIKSKNEIVVGVLSFNFKNDLIFDRANLSSKEKSNFKKKLLIASQVLNLETDKKILNEIKDLRRILTRYS